MEDHQLWISRVLEAPTMEQQEAIDRNQGVKMAMIFPRISAVVSILAVICVFMETLAELRKAKKSQGDIDISGTRIRSTTSSRNFNTIHYVQFFYQIPLFCFSLANALGSLPAPSDVGIWGAAGTTGTCTAQGIINQFGVIGTLFWDACLSFTYLAMAKQWKVHDWKFRYHYITWPILLVACIYPLFKDMYNFNFTACWINQYPDDCVGDECLRGEGADFWTNFASFLSMMHLIYSIAVMAWLFFLIRRIENNTSSWQQASSTPAEGGSANRQYSRAILTQGLLYASGMVLTTLPMVINVLLDELGGFHSDGFGVFAMTMVPLVGYINFLIYMRNLKPKDCLTKYGRLLRKAHALCFDYNLVCQCQCGPQDNADKKNPAVSPPKEKPLEDGGKQKKSPSPPPARSVQPTQVSEGSMSGKWNVRLTSVGMDSVAEEREQPTPPPRDPLRMISEVDTFEQNPTPPPRDPLRMISEVDTIFVSPDVESLGEDTKPSSDSSSGRSPFQLGIASEYDC